MYLLKSEPKSYIHGKMDEEVRGNGVGKTVGSTAVVAVVGEEEVVVANCRDSRVVMCSGGVALALSKDHKVRVLCTFSFYCFNFPKMKNATKSNGLRLEIETGKR